MKSCQCGNLKHFYRIMMKTCVVYAWCSPVGAHNGDHRKKKGKFKCYYKYEHNRNTDKNLIFEIPWLNESPLYRDGSDHVWSATNIRCFISIDVEANFQMVNLLT